MLNNHYIWGVQIKKRSVSRRLYIAICLLLISSLLVTTASFAWLTLSLAPETTEITTTVGSNGNLEIALATKGKLSALQANNMYDDSTVSEFATGNSVHDNVLWGNLIDLTDEYYGFHSLKMRPSMLNIVNGNIAEIPISIGKYGADGRLENVVFSLETPDLTSVGFTGVYNSENQSCFLGQFEMSFDDLKAGNYNKVELVRKLLEYRDYGVRFVGPLEYSPFIDDLNNTCVKFSINSYCFAIDLLFRTNAAGGNLMLQTESAQRVESELHDEYLGGGSILLMENEQLRTAIRIVFADTLTGKIYAVAQADDDGKLWITERADETGMLTPTADDDSAMIKPLMQNQVSAITAWVYIDGNSVDNSDAAATTTTLLSLNLQFSTDVELHPAYMNNAISNSPNSPETPDEEIEPTLPEGYILFGEYPQSLKADDVEITSTVDDRGYYLGSDGFYYAKAVANHNFRWSSYESFTNGEAIVRGNTYYFKVEPIRWRILSENDGELFILCDSIIDCHVYDAGGNSNYQLSDIRKWLNDYFYNTAFSTQQTSLIKTTIVDNSLNSTGDESNSYICQDTNDKIFLLSYQEVTNRNLGFISDKDRQIKKSDYAIVMGVDSWSSWALRTPASYDSGFIKSVNFSGSAGFSSSFVDGGVGTAEFYENGVVPAMWITK